MKNMSKYNFQKASKIPHLESTDYPPLIHFKKRRFGCKEYRKTAVAKISLIKKDNQIASIVH